MSQRILICDSYYPEVIRALPVDPSLGYEDNLKTTLGFSFGTADVYSRNLREVGWRTCDVIVNHEPLQEMWANEHGMDGRRTPWTSILFAQIADCHPDVVFMQDLSVLNAELLNLIGTECVLAGQCSCPMPPIENVKQFDVIFSSFPHYIPRFQELGVKAIYNPLAFDPIVIERAVDGMTSGRFSRHLKERPHDVVFIGGVGNPSHWKYGMEVLETVAREIPGFRWWGYGFEHLPKGMALPNAYCGEAYGLDMYQILLQSKICLNRHGEVAEGYANNMRLFEATGTGALLLTEGTRNLRDFFYGDEVATYSSPKDAVNQIRHFLDDEQDRKWVASKGQKRTLKDHTYAQRMRVVSETLKGML